MSSTLYRSSHLAPVIRLARRRVGATLLVRVGLVSDEAVYRWVGIEETTSIAECCNVVGEVFGTTGIGADAPQELKLHDVLRSPGQSTHFSRGLWSFEMQLADIYPRDESTAPSVCVAGSGAFGGVPFDIAQVNARLIGEVTGVGCLRAEVRDFMARAKGHDFAPLLQALDVGAGPRLASLPVEDDPVARDAFWSIVFALTCCAGEETAQIAQSIFSSLGHEESYGEMRSRCAESLARLDAVAGERSQAAMLEIYRQLMRG